MTPVQAQSIGIFAYSTLLGPNGLNVAMGEICPILGWEADFPDDAAVETREVLKQLSPALQTEGLDTEALQRQLTMLEPEGNPIVNGKPLYWNWGVLGDVSHTLQMYPAEPYSHAADTVRLANNYAVRLLDPSNQFFEKVKTVLAKAQAKNSSGDFSKMDTDELFSFVISQTTQEGSAAALEELRSRKEHQKIVELLGFNPKGTLSWRYIYTNLSEYKGLVLDLPFKHAVFALIQKYFDEFREYSLAMVFISKFDEARGRQALELLIEKGNARQIVIVRKQAESQQIRWNARAALDAKVDIIDDVDTLEIIAAFGKDVEARLQAVSRLIGRGAQSALHSVATGDGLGWGWNEYQNATVIEAAKEGELQLIAEKSAGMK